MRLADIEVLLAALAVASWSIDLRRAARSQPATPSLPRLLSRTENLALKSTDYIFTVVPAESKIAKREVFIKPESASVATSLAIDPKAKTFEATFADGETFDLWLVDTNASGVASDPSPIFKLAVPDLTKPAPPPAIAAAAVKAAA